MHLHTRFQYYSTTFVKKTVKANNRPVKSDNCIFTLKRKLLFSLKNCIGTV